MLDTFAHLLRMLIIMLVRPDLYVFFSINDAILSNRAVTSTICDCYIREYNNLDFCRN